MLRLGFGPAAEERGRCPEFAAPAIPATSVGLMVDDLTAAAATFVSSVLLLLRRRRLFSFPDDRNERHVDG